MNHLQELNTLLDNAIELARGDQFRKIAEKAHWGDKAAMKAVDELHMPAAKGNPLGYAKQWSESGKGAKLPFHWVLPSMAVKRKELAEQARLMRGVVKHRSKD